MIVFVAGMSRAGSMWTYNSTREILKAANFKVLPDLIPSNEVGLIKQALISPEKEKEVYCIKTHEALTNPLPTQHKVKIICNHRDVRDACLSYMRFRRADFEAGMIAMRGMMEITDYYLKTFKEHLHVVRYQQISSNPKQVIEKLSEFLEVPLSASKVYFIAEEYGKEKVKKKLEEISDIKVDHNGQIKGAKYQSKYEAIRNLDGTFRVYDKNTAFQSNHITAKKDGEWREILNEKQAQQMNKLCYDWLIKYDYLP